MHPMGNIMGTLLPQRSHWGDQPKRVPRKGCRKWPWRPWQEDPKKSDEKNASIRNLVETNFFKRNDFFKSIQKCFGRYEIKNPPTKIRYPLQQVLLKMRGSFRQCWGIKGFLEGIQYFLSTSPHIDFCSPPRRRKWSWGIFDKLSLEEKTSRKISKNHANSIPESWGSFTWGFLGDVSYGSSHYTTANRSKSGWLATPRGLDGSSWPHILIHLLWVASHLLSLRKVHL